MVWYKDPIIDIATHTSYESIWYDTLLYRIRSCETEKEPFPLPWLHCLTQTDSVPNPNRTESDEIYQYDTMSYRSGLGSFGGPKFQAIFHGRTILVLGQYGSACHELDGLKRFQKSWPDMGWYAPMMNLAYASFSPFVE